ncbi:MAG: hypothetical protein WC756_00795 [Taibaiella sp.]|jgi:hypothetical protein
MIHFQALKSNKALRRFCLIIVSSFFLLLPALYNGFPIVTQDTGTNIACGWKFYVPIDRPITYGIFILISSLFGISLWGVVWAQTFILVYYLRRVVEKLLGTLYNDRFFLAIIIILTAFTTIPWYCSQLLPDIFTSILVLAVVDFYLSPRGSLGKRILTFIAICIFIEMHNSHLIIALIFCVCARFYSLVRRNKWFIKKTLVLFFITLTSFVTISFFNLWEGNSFRPSASSHVFLMARMTETGLLDDFLKEYCPTEHYTLCKYQGQTGDRYWDFMWSDKGHLHDVGGWDKAEKEYNTIIRRTLTRPKYLAFHIYESFEGTLRQLSQYTIEFVPQGPGSSPYNTIEQYYPREIKEYRTSLQQIDRLGTKMPVFDVVFLFFGLGTIVVALFVYNNKPGNPGQLNWNFTLIIFLAFSIVNAWVTATFSTVYLRMESRVLWLIPFACTLYILKNYLEQRESRQKHISP